MDIAEKKEILNEIGLNEEITMVFPDGYNAALIGYTTTGTTQTVPVYDKTKCIHILMEDDGLSEEDALEHFYYNTVRACEYLGDECPVFVDLFE